MVGIQTILLIVVLVPSALGQQIFTFTKLSGKYTVQLRPEKFDQIAWSGKTKVSIIRKGSTRPIQIFHLQDTYISLNDSGQPDEAEIRDKQNGKWSTVYLDDLNFDGLEDLAVADGVNGGYSSVSYRVYLFDGPRKRFFYSKAFTRLAQGPFIGMPYVYPKTKTIEVFWKSGVGFHEIQRYKIVRNKPVRFYERSESTMIGDGNRYITTKTLINGRWKTWEKTIKDTEQN